MNTSPELDEIFPDTLNREITTRRHFGAAVTPKGVEYGSWFPHEHSAEVLIWRANGEHVVLPTRRFKDGFHRVLDEDGGAGDEYMFRKGDGQPFQDPASSAITKLHDRSIVVDQSSYGWKDQAWKRPPFRDLVIYEVHVGTFTEAGTFRGLISRLPFLKDLGVNAIELLPVADFPGERNWGYDGVLLYAPAKDYGTPDDLKALVDESHAMGIAIILDVVYNHLGPDGNYLPACSRQFFSRSHETPWGKGFNFDGAGSKPVRDFFRENLIYWMEDFHIDGFRLDATHAIKDASNPHILAEMAQEVDLRDGYIVAEDERNDDVMLAAREEGGYGFNAVWADDFHHSVRVALTGDQSSYFQDFAGTPAELADILANGWLFRGQVSQHTGKNRGTECAYLPPCNFIHSITNHDQVGNRAMGERLSSYVTAAQYRAASVLLCFTPYTPMLFMGQEWAASTPFQFFTDHNDELGPLVTEGRRKEFAGFPEFSDPTKLDAIPDPQDLETFTRSKLIWDETRNDTHQQILELYKSCLQLRRGRSALRPKSRDGWLVSVVDGVVLVRYQDPADSFLLLINLWGPSRGDLAAINTELVPEGSWKIVLSSNDVRFGGKGSGFSEAEQSFAFSEAEVVLLQEHPASTPA